MKRGKKKKGQEAELCVSETEWRALNRKRKFCNIVIPPFLKRFNKIEQNGR